MIRKITVTGADLTTNVDEDDADEWDSGTTYDQYDEVISTTTHNLYRSVGGGNLNHDPDDADPDSDSQDQTYWQFRSKTRPYRMFDNYGNTVTTNADTIEVTIDSGQLINSIGLIGVSALTIDIDQYDEDDNLVYSTTIDMVDYGVTDWYEYFFEEIPYKENAVVANLLPYATGYVTITIDNTGGTAMCGALVLGSRKLIGRPRPGYELSNVDYSTKEEDQWGSSTLTEGQVIKRMDVPLQIYKDDTTWLDRLLTAYRATMTVWVGTDNREDSILYGYVRSHKFKQGDSLLITDVSLELRSINE